MDLLLSGLDAALADASRSGGTTAADAIRTTDTVSKIAFHRARGYTVGGMAKGAGMLAPGLATMLVRAHHRRRPGPGRPGPRRCARRPGDLRPAGHRRLHVHQRHRAAAGQRGRGNRPDAGEFAAVLTEVCADLARQLQADAEGASKLIAVEVVGAASEQDAVTAGRAVARSQPAQVRHRRGGPQLGPGALRGGYHRRGLRAGPPQRRHQRRLGLPQRLRRRRPVQGGPAAAGT